jgi:hypothetical protein
LARQFQEDIVAEKFLVTAIREPEFGVAERLIERYAFDRRLRGLGSNGVLACREMNGNVSSVPVFPGFPAHDHAKDGLVQHQGQDGHHGPLA